MEINIESIKALRGHSRPNRFSVSVSDETLNVMDRYCSLVGISRGKLIDLWVTENKELHEKLLLEIEAVLEAEKDG